jgi:hypothetical protein
MTNWNIHSVDGTYIGQSEALKAETAFCQYMELRGHTITERDIRAVQLSDGSCLLTYAGRDYIATKTLTSAPPLP